MAKTASVPVKKEKATITQPHSWDPWLGLRGEIDNVFERFAGNGYMDAFWERHPDVDLFNWAPPLGMRPQVDMAETDKAYEISVELPGMNEKDIELIMRDGALTIKGEKKEEKEDKKKDYRVTERRYGRFQRSFALPQGADTGKIAAKFKNGVLSITLPKTKEARQHQRRIPIKASSG